MTNNDIPTSLKQLLEKINPMKPYVWKLKITGPDYELLKSYFRNRREISDQPTARLAIIYIAEWYKREYDGNVVNPICEVTAESLWKKSRFNASAYVYKTNRTHRFLESIYMLGGLPMKFIINRGDNKLLKALCRIYKGDKSTLEDDKSLGVGQAIAFQESILQEASLYNFLKALLINGEKEVYAIEDLTSNNTLVKQFIDAVKTAYDEVLRDKFRLEWIIENNVASPYMRRMIRLWLRPEELGGLHQYLRFDRANSWNIPDLINQRNLKISLEFYEGTTLVGDENTRKPIIYFENSGQDDAGFVATGVNPWGLLKSLPTEPFDKIKLILTDDAGTRHELPQSFECKQQYLQLWMMQDEVNRWSSTRNNQSETAVVFSDFYALDEIENNRENERVNARLTKKSFFDKTNGLSTPWNFSLIEKCVTLYHEPNASVTLWNRNGYVRFCPDLYNNVLKYRDGKVRYVYNEDSDIFSETEEWYYAIFQRSDIKAFHFTTRQLIDAQPDSQEIQNIEYKAYDDHDDVRYKQWDNDTTPPYGRLKLRLTIKDEQHIYIVLHLPSMLNQGADVPVVRDFENGKIVFVNSNDGVQQISIPIAKDKKPLGITESIKVWGNQDEYVELDVYLPTLVKEVYLDGSIVKYLEDEEEFELPYILKNRIAIHDYNKGGYFEYECFNIGDCQERGSIGMWRDGTKLALINELAAKPKYVNVVYGTEENDGSIPTLLYWDYNAETLPTAEPYNFDQMGNYSILFQDMRNVNEDLICIPPETNNEPIDDNDWDIILDSDPEEEAVENNSTLLQCYDVATNYKTYYFIFNPLFNMENEDSFIKGILNPLKERLDNNFQEEDIQNLMRCSTECGLNWEIIEREI